MRGYLRAQLHRHLVAYDDESCCPYTQEQSVTALVIREAPEARHVHGAASDVVLLAAASFG